ncbi:nudC domain-containing protein 2 isoform X1 [Magallana gigas]|uniref:nudC domain-containing protein 2 isoform X1 n=1 Tax=Magallana gigas TaxID=29159 RepID=UPI003340F7D6
MAHFDEKSGYIPCKTEWGQWWQTNEEVFIEINVPQGTLAKDIKCAFAPKHIKIAVKGETVIEGDLPSTIHSDEALWTLEDKKFLRVFLPKGLAVAENLWNSLLVGQYETDAWTFDQMEKKATLQKYQEENPGFDFSGADISGNYHKGGPKLSDK